MFFLEVPVEYLDARIMELLGGARPSVSRGIRTRLLKEGLDVAESRLYKMYNGIRAKWRLVVQVNFYVLGIRDSIITLKDIP